MTQRDTGIKLLVCNYRYVVANISGHQMKRKNLMKVHGRPQICDSGPQLDLGPTPRSE